MSLQAKISAFRTLVSFSMGERYSAGTTPVTSVPAAKGLNAGITNIPSFRNHTKQGIFRKAPTRSLILIDGCSWPMTRGRASQG